jgi:iron complex outermembrane receptor protein
MVLLDSPRASMQHAVYAQDEIRLARWLIVNAGLRYDGYEKFHRVTPRAALIVLPSSTQSVKYLYGRAFRSPNAFESTTEFFGEGVDDLRPESIDTHELVWERYIPSYPTTRHSWASRSAIRGRSGRRASSSKRRCASGENRGRW